MICPHRFIESLEPRQHLAATPVKDIIPADGTGQPGNFAELNGLLYFTADDGSGWALWRSDGTATGTYAVQPLPLYVNYFYEPYEISLTAIGDSLYYAGTTSDSAYQIWKTDGSPNGAVLLKQLDGFVSVSPWAEPGFTHAGSAIYFAAPDASGYELWKTDGTPQGTVLVKDIFPGSASSVDYQPNFTAFNGRLLFFAGDGTTWGLWTSDGTPAGTVPLKDIPATGRADPHTIVTMNGSAHFFATDGQNDQLWRTDGTPQGTALVKDFGPYDYPRFNLQFESPAVLDGKLYFVATTGDDPQHAASLWQSDGTTAGTVRLAGFPSNLGQDLWNTRFIAFNGQLLFGAVEYTETSGYGHPGLYAIDPSTGTVRAITKLPSLPESLEAQGGHLSFVTSSGGEDGIWRSDGTTAGTARLAVSNYYPAAAGRNRVEINGTTYFASRANDGAPDLFKTGTADFVAALTGPTFMLSRASGGWWPGLIRSWVQVIDADTLNPRVGFDLPWSWSGAAVSPIARGDFDGNGRAEIIVGAAPGAAAILRVLDADSFAPLKEFPAFDPQYLGGVGLATGDVNADGCADLIVSAGAGAGPHVKVFNGATLLQPAPQELGSFWAFDPAFLGGVNIAAGDFNADGREDVYAAAAPGAGPHAKIFSAASLVATPSAPAELGSFWADDPSVSTGVNLAAGDFDGDARSDVVAGVGSAVRIFASASFAASATPTPFRAFSAYTNPWEVVSETRPAVLDLDLDTQAEILTAPGTFQGAFLRAFDNADFAPLPAPDLFCTDDNDIRITT